MMNELLHKYVNKQLTKEEAQRFKQWIKSAPVSEIEENISCLWEGYTIKEPRNREAYHTITNKLQLLLNRKMKAEKISMNHYLVRIAAILLLPVLLAAGVYYFTKQHSYNMYAMTQYQVETGKGERATLILPDSTKVFLNSESTFAYQASFGKVSRQVHLEGEAYFEVAHNPKLPFLVQTQQANIKVVGTIFNIHAYPADEWVETALVEGKVEFYEATNPNNRIMLSQNQTARFNINRRTFERDITEQRLATAWKRDELIFRSASWSSVIEKISSYYGVTIRQDEGETPQEHFTGSFLQEDVNNVLQNLQLHYHFTYTKSGNLIKIKFE